ncbi:hypothetical protein CCR94_01030 [Rhodoblastus sphagnicola]|uniref:T6SS Phospholipase effector Tle1-like catalytic domain-containing protein n=1 Tax=Rhodoblastus sphagnicola TaxID=333368 RepID=A0A2S6NGB0_9HYPH|nr:DUF2235 domain-containing protein [Rhodoblastus sphagnicola]MBB4200707.1 uncharacterized protein (DUF2235 family) [Rhodoblastus sphagnicola]PPQ33624.1 hypothetical protein CCR94_01030 [Rhodoblastus sphagnicola]
MDEIESKRLCLFIDGTWNTIDNNTNVWRMYSLCAAKDDAGKRQLVYYTKGVGTSVGAKLSGGLFGYGIEEIIAEAYEWLIPRYNSGDEIFIFGFSRGAYAARSLAGLIAKSGIVRPGSPIGVGELFKRYKSPEARTLYRLIDQDRTGTLGETSILERWLLKYSLPAPIRMVGVWDTVGALVGPYSYLETGLRKPVENAYHALAIDEHRDTFRPTLYTQNFHLDRPAAEQPGPRDISSVEQRWFVGAHANVGGGYNSDLLAQIPLRWLKRKAEAHGMKFSSELDAHDESCEAKITDSFKQMLFGLYALVKLGKPYYRKIGDEAVVTPKLRTVTVNETIDGSVFERVRRCGDYAPLNLTDWANRRGVALKAITGAVRADDPGVAVD